MKKIYCLFLFLLVLFSFVSAKEVHVYFTTNGGKAASKNISVDDVYVTLKSTGDYYATYNDTDIISKVNSINGETFRISLRGKKLVSGKEWYVFDKDYKKYYFSQSKSYSVSSIIKILGIENDSIPMINMYANWESTSSRPTSTNRSSSSRRVAVNGVSLNHSSITITVSSTKKLKVSFSPSNASNKNLIWSSNDKSIATVDQSGNVNGISPGTARITVRSNNGKTDSCKVVVKKAPSNHYVQIQYHLNGGSFNTAHDSNITSSNQYILCDKNIYCSSIAYGGYLPSFGLRDINNANYINLVRDGYYVSPSAAWIDQNGKTYSQTDVYSSNDFCDASMADCTVTLYANWQRSTPVYKIAFIGNSKTYYRADYPKSNVIEVFKYMVTSTGKTAEITRITKGGSSLIYKTKNQGKEKEQFVDYITSDAFHYAVLQEQTDTALSDINKYKAGASKIKKLLVQKNPNVKVFIRATWPLNDGNFSNGINTMTNNAKTVSNAIGGYPIYESKAFKKAKSEGFSLYVADKRHPSAEGAYLTAACIYKNIFQVRAVDIQRYYGINKEKAIRLLQIADETC